MLGRHRNFNLTEKTNRKMPTEKINGLTIYYELTGTKGDALVLVHGSWGDHHNWDAPANVAGNSFGAAMTLKCAASHADLFASVIFSNRHSFA